MSSQGANASTISHGYAFDIDSIRDASDRTSRIVQQRTYKNYNSSSTDNVTTEPIWMKQNSQFRLTFAFGKFKCTSCNGNAFNAITGSS